jgi:sigma-B regulation protein RsbU (phosphoserine phosphatase)
MDVQQNLLPKEAPRVEGYEIAGKSVYCDETGGDYYDFIDLSKLGNGRIGIAVGDISGHGFAAALLMTTVRALLRSRATRSNSLQELMNDINRHLARDTQGGRFMTLFYLIIDQGQPALRWINAGHDPALVFDCASGTFDELSGRGIPIGIEDSWDYEENTQTQLDSGSIVIIGTDGIWETRNPAGEMYGKDVLKALIKENSAKTATEICDLVHDTLTMFRGDGPQADDITLVVIKKDPGACAA